MPDESHKGPIVVTHDGGVRFSAQVRSHRLVVDQPRAGGGEDSGPMPIELLGISLGTCIAYYVHQFLLARKLPHVGLRVEVEQHSARNPSRVAEFLARVVLPAPLPAPYPEMLERVVHSCPAHNTLAGATPVRVSIETPAAAVM
jgi:putative redox protein